MMTIEEEIKKLVSFLSHEAGFGVNIVGSLCIYPIYEMREYWEVSWNLAEDNTECEFHKQFVSLEEAATFFVEKRRYLCLGSDFNQIVIDDKDGID